MKYIKTYLKISVASIIIAFIYHYVVGNYLNYSWPYNSILCPPYEKFSDFFTVSMSGKFVYQGISPYGKGVLNIYMPFMNWITILFSFGADKLRFGIFVFFIIIAFFIFFYKSIYKLNGENRKEALEYTFFLLISSYPIMFLIDRGNFEILVFVFLSLFICFYKKGNYNVATFMLMISTSIKPFSLVFITLLLSNKKYKQLFYYITGTFAIFIISLSLLHGGFIINFKNWLQNLNTYNMYFVDLLEGTWYNHTLFCPIHLINWIYFIYTFTQIRKIYFSIAVIIFILISLYILEKEKSLSRKVFLLFLCMVGLPYVSADYTLINMYIPIMLFISEIKNEKDNKYTNIIIILSALLMIPKNYSVPIINLKYGLSIFIDPIIISVLFIIIILYSKKCNKDGTQIN